MLSEPSDCVLNFGNHAPFFLSRHHLHRARFRASRQVNDKTYEGGPLLRLGDTSRGESTQQAVPILEPKKAKSGRKPLRFRDSAAAEEKTPQIEASIREGKGGAPGGTPLVFFTFVPSFNKVRETQPVHHDVKFYCRKT